MEFKLLRRIGLFMGLGHLLSLLFVELVLSAEKFELFTEKPE